MWELVQKRDSTSAVQQLAQMLEELASISEKERVLRGRSADREAYRYLLDAHRLTVRANSFGDQALDVSPSPFGSTA